MAAIAVALGVFTLALIGWRAQWGWLHAIDAGTLASWVSYDSKHRGWVRLNEVISAAGSPLAFRLVGLVFLTFALRRRALRVAVFLLAGIGVGGIVVNVVKVLADRPRPPDALVGSFGSSFPSSHAFGVAAGALCLLLLAWPHMHRRGWRLVAAAGALLLTLLVGFSRVALTVHYVSDVVAGAALGIAWVLGCYVAVRLAGRSPRRRTGDAAAGR